MSASNSTPFLKKENHFSVSMQNILCYSSLWAYPREKIPVTAPSVSNSAALYSASARELLFLQNCSGVKLLPSKFFPAAFELLWLFYALFSMMFLFFLLVLTWLLLNSSRWGQLRSANHRREKAIRSAAAAKTKNITQQPARESGSHHWEVQTLT